MECVLVELNLVGYENKYFLSNRFVFKRIGMVGMVFDCEELLGVTHSKSIIFFLFFVVSCNLYDTLTE